MSVGPTIYPALWCDHGHWQVTQDETCLYLPKGRWGYWKCRLWCWRNGYSWLPIS